MKIGELLRLGRERKGFSLEELGRRLNYDKSFLSRIENGDRPAAYDLVKRWARICECEDLVTLDLGGNTNGSMKLRQLEMKMKQIKELVSFMKIKPGRR